MRMPPLRGCYVIQAGWHAWQTQRRVMQVVREGISSFFFLWGRYGVVLPDDIRTRQQLSFFSNYILAFRRTLLLRLIAVLQATRLLLLFVMAVIDQ